jgi:hypothetical protein
MPTGGASPSEFIGIVNAAFVGIFNAGQQPLEPPRGAVLSGRATVGQADRPAPFHQRRIGSTVNAAMSWSMPT